MLVKLGEEKLGTLVKMANEAMIDSKQQEAAMFTDDPKSALIKLLLDHDKLTGEAAANTTVVHNQPCRGRRSDQNSIRKKSNTEVAAGAGHGAVVPTHI